MVLWRSLSIACSLEWKFLIHVLTSIKKQELYKIMTLKEIIVEEYEDLLVGMRDDLPFQYFHGRSAILGIVLAFWDRICLIHGDFGQPSSGL